MATLVCSRFSAAGNKCLSPYIDAFGSQSRSFPRFLAEAKPAVGGKKRCPNIAPELSVTLFNAPPAQPPCAHMSIIRTQCRERESENRRIHGPPDAGESSRVSLPPISSAFLPAGPVRVYTYG